MSAAGATPSVMTTRAWEGLNPDVQRALRPQLETHGGAMGLTILVADDEAAIRDLAGQVLRPYGYTVLEAADGLEALEVAERHPGPIDLLLTDWCMPRLDGEGLIRKMSTGRPETAILVMSGCIDAEWPPKTAVLHKPFKLQDLVESVSGALQGRERHD